jgi:glutaryl-CoA dehydrogenase
VERAIDREHSTRTTPPLDYYLADGLMTEAERAVRDRVRAFAEVQLRPVARQAWERGEFPSQLLPALATLGIVGGTVQGHGCPGLSNVAFGLAMQELARVDSSFATFVAVHGGFVPTTIAGFGSEEQKDRWLPALARCEQIGAFALTEPDHGSDASHLATSAQRDGDDYVLNGAKRWIGNVTVGDLVVVWARAEDEIAGFLVELPNPGLVASPIEGKLAQRSVAQAEIALTECRVPTANRLPVGGFRATAEVLLRARHNAAWHALGEAIACYEIARDYALRRQQFGKPIAAFQLTQVKLVEMLAAITATQLLVLQLGRAIDAGQATAGMASLAKLSSTAMARTVAATARGILGGNGILQDYEVMRHLCDLEAVYTYEGTWEINALVVGREVTGHAAFA